MHSLSLDCLSENGQVPFNPFYDTTAQSRTAETESMYSAKAVRLAKQAAGELDLPQESASCCQTVAWLLKKMEKISRATFRQYKSCLIYHYVQELRTPDALNAARYLIKINDNLALKKGTQTSARKSKSIDRNRLERLFAYLSANKDLKFAAEVICWLQAGLLCGLRPVEWCHAQLVDYAGVPALKIKNAKATNGRSNGAYRLLKLSGLSEHDLNIIKRQIYNVQSRYVLGQYEPFYRSCSATLCKANNAVFGRNSKRRIVLYSARHQFAANAKAGNLDSAEVAALMGHASDDTNVAHYGKRRHGTRGGLRVEPLPEQVQTVKRVHNRQRFEQFLAEKNQWQQGHIRENRPDAPQPS